MFSVGCAGRNSCEVVRKPPRDGRSSKCALRGSSAQRSERHCLQHTRGEAFGHDTVTGSRGRCGVWGRRIIADGRLGRLFHSS